REEADAARVVADGVHGDRPKLLPRVLLPKLGWRHSHPFDDIDEVDAGVIGPRARVAVTAILGSLTVRCLCRGQAATDREHLSHREHHVAVDDRTGAPGR